jgi:hypothetical protein
MDPNTTAQARAATYAAAARLDAALVLGATGEEMQALLEGLDRAAEAWTRAQAAGG